MPEPNMTVRGMQQWRSTEAYAEYRRYRDDQKYSGYTRNVTDRALAVIRGEATPAQEEKVRNYIARAKGGYQSTGAGSRKFAGVAKNVAALRNWGYDPYDTYT